MFMSSTETEQMLKLVTAYAPPPKRFHMIWSQRGGEGREGFYVWKPVPHSGRFVALGMVVVRRPLRFFQAAVLADIYLCNVCSFQEILRRNGRG
jgi:hypothetical protein